MSSSDPVSVSELVSTLRSLSVVLSALTERVDASGLSFVVQPAPTTPPSPASTSTTPPDVITPALSPLAVNLDSKAIAVFAINYPHSLTAHQVASTLPDIRLSSLRGSISKLIRAGYLARDVRVPLTRKGPYGPKSVFSFKITSAGRSYAKPFLSE